MNRHIKELAAASGDWFVLTSEPEPARYSTMDRVAFFVLADSDSTGPALGAYSGSGVVDLGKRQKLVYGSDRSPDGTTWSQMFDGGRPGVESTQRYVDLQEL